MVEIDETEDERLAGQRSTYRKPDQPGRRNRDQPSCQGHDHLLRDNGCRKLQRHNENHGSRRIKHLFLVSRKIMLQNHT